MWFLYKKPQNLFLSQWKADKQHKNQEYLLEKTKIVTKIETKNIFFIKIALIAKNGNFTPWGIQFCDFSKNRHKNKTQ